MINNDNCLVIKNIAKHLKSSKHTLILTGAGMSTDSGIPDFRSNTGLYSKYSQDILSRSYFYSKPDLFYNAFNEKFSSIINAKPNKGHYILADWEKRGLVHSICTQNIDGLHQEAGNKVVYEMHGSIRTFYLKNKGKTKKYSLEEVLNSDGMIDYKRRVEGSEMTYYLKPDVVLFGEEIKHFSKISDLIRTEVEFMMILGTSLSVYPFASLPYLMRKKYYCALINKEPISLEKGYLLPIWGDITTILELIDEELKK